MASAGIVAATLFATEPGAAHLRLLAPMAREPGAVVGGGPNGSLKQGPCGQIVNGRTDKVSVFAPGETIEVTWDEFVNHRSHYRVAFDVEADDDFPLFPGPGVSEYDPTEACPVDGRIILAYELADRIGGMHTLNVQLPDVECERCTLQVIQYMYETGSPYYFQCADLALRRVGADAGAVDAGAADAAAGEAGANGSPAGGYSVPDSCRSPLVSTGVAAGGAAGTGAGGNGDTAGGSGGVAPMGTENAPVQPVSQSSGARISGGGCGLRDSAAHGESPGHGIPAMFTLLLAAAGAARRRAAGRGRAGPYNPLT